MRKDSELGWHPGVLVLSCQWGPRFGALTRSVAGDETTPPCSAHGFTYVVRAIALGELPLRIFACLKSSRRLLLSIGCTARRKSIWLSIYLDDLLPKLHPGGSNCIHILHTYTNRQVREPTTDVDYKISLSCLQKFCLAPKEHNGSRLGVLHFTQCRLALESHVLPCTPHIPCIITSWAYTPPSAGVFEAESRETSAPYMASPKAESSMPMSPKSPGVSSAAD